MKNLVQGIALSILLVIVALVVVVSPLVARDGSGAADPLAANFGVVNAVAAVDSAAPDSATEVPGFFDSWDARARMRFGVARITLDDSAGAVFPIYLTLNYRVSINALPSEPSTLRLGLGLETGIFYLYPYAMLGPELRYGDFYLEGHGGATFIFLVGSDTPGGRGASIAGLSAGWIVGSEEVIRAELQAGFDVITIYKDTPSTGLMPHVTAAIRF